PIPFSEMAAIYNRSLKSLEKSSTELVSESFVSAKVKSFAHQKNIVAHFWSRHLFTIEGGPPPIIFPSIQLRDSALTHAIDDRISTDDDFRSLAKICLSQILESKS